MPGSPPPGKELEPDQPKSIYLVSYPKIVFMYPTMIAAFLAGIFVWIAHEDDPRTHVVSALFMVLFTVNLVVFAFDFPRTTSLTLFFFMVAVIMALLLFFKFNDELLPFINKILRTYTPQANATFFLSISSALALIYLAVLINVQFDYWEVTPNELLHHHGVLSNLERYSSPNLKIDMEINDVFEYFLMRSGRLILHPSSEPRAIVLENVMRIKTKEALLMRMLGALQVQVRVGPRGGDSSVGT
ncbi:MAG: hypothetical protein HY290_23010 [Planctomycetia bacterium]|nr:hypothetical protein [Planctomycetia bacterium]